MLPVVIMMRLLGMALMLAVLPGAQVKTLTPRKMTLAEAEIIWSGNQMYDLCQHGKTYKWKGSLGPGCAMDIAGATQTLLLNHDIETRMNGTLPGKGVTGEQVTDVVTKWMDVQPQKRKAFVFVAGVEDVRWNIKLNRNLVLWTGGV